MIGDRGAGIEARPIERRDRNCLYRHRGCNRDRVRATELVVKADLHLVEVLLEIDDGRVRQRYAARTEAQIVILGLGRPARRQSQFETATDGPAELMGGRGQILYTRIGADILRSAVELKAGIA